MDKTIIGLFGAASAAALIGGAEATSALAGPAPLPPAQTYAELLDPIPDAVSRLRTQNGDGEPIGTVEERPVQLAQYYYHHHHHHHHHYYRYHHHHHHHYYHHHHHHHHHYYQYY